MQRQLLKYNIIFLILIYSCHSENEKIIEAHFKSLSSIGVGILDQCDPNAEVYDILFATSPYSQIAEIDYSPVSELAKVIVTIKKEKYIHDYVAQIDELFKRYYKNGDTVLEKELLKHYLSLNQRRYTTLEKDLDLIKRGLKKVEAEINENRYYKTHLLNQKAERKLTINKAEEALAIYFYNLGRLTKEDYLQSEIYLNLSNAIELQFDEVLSYEPIIDKLIDLLDQYDFYAFDKQMNKNYTDEDSVKFLYNAKEIAKSPFEHYVVNYNLAFYYDVLNPNVDSARYYYDQTIAVYENTPCNYFKFPSLLYYAEYLKSPEEKKIILEKLEAYKNCEPSIRDYIDFVKLQYIDPSAFTNDVDSMVYLLMEQRVLAMKLYPGESSLHLQDYYAQNCRLIHQNIAKKKGSYSNRDIEILSSVFYDTRAKEETRATISASNKGGEGTDNIYAEIDSVLRELNDFKKIRDFKNPIYERLYNLYEEKNLLEKQMRIQGVETNELDKESLLNKCNSSTTTVYNFISVTDDYSTDFYCVYKILNNTLSLFTIDKVQLDSMGNVLLDKIKKKEDVTSEKNQLQRLIFNDHNFNEQEELAVIPDGIIGQLPLSLMVGDNNITVSQFPTIKNWVEQKEITVSKDDVHLYSYSDEQTLKDKSIKTFTDLPFAHEECDEIQELLNINETDVLMGNDVNKESILSIDKDSWLHLSTHAFSNMGNRLDNFIAVRDESGKGEKLYSYELMTIAHPPKVVVLSACDSGIGTHLTGTGVFSVSKAFLSLGTDTVIKTLWKVNDEITKEFMIEFYRHLAGGNTISDALGLTQSVFKSHTIYSDPYYWAGFVVEGNGDISLSK